MKGIAMSHRLILVLLSGTCCFAQPTWNNLTFGMNMAEVRAALAKPELSLERTKDEWKVQPDWVLSLPAMPSPLHFTPWLTFSNADKLDRIILGLRTEPDRTGGLKAPALTMVAAKSLHEQLVGKYGAPVSQAGTCDRVSINQLVGGPGKVECKTLWRGGGQTITLTWSYYEESLGVGKLFLSITYLPSQNSGL